MVYKMNLASEPFILIKEGHKDIEMRLASKGRENIKSKDHILFTNPLGEELLVEVISVSSFPTFEALYKHFDKTRLGYRPNEKASPEDMLIYYKKEDIERFGVLAIEIKLANLQK